MAVRLRNYWGEESEESLLPLTIGAPEAGEVRETADSDAPEVLDLSGLDIQDALIWDEGIEETQAGTRGQAAAEQTSEKEQAPRAAGGELLGHEPGRIRPDRPRPPEGHLGFDDAADYGDGRGQTEHVYPTFTPARTRSPMSRTARGELHGQSQGVHVLEEDTDGDGYVLIEAYANDGTKTDNEYMESRTRKRCRATSKKSILFEVKPSDKYALLVDKLRQKLSTSSRRARSSANWTYPRGSTTRNSRTTNPRRANTSR